MGKAHVTGSSAGIKHQEIKWSKVIQTESDCGQYIIPIDADLAGNYMAAAKGETTNIGIAGLSASFRRDHIEVNVNFSNSWLPRTAYCDASIVENMIWGWSFSAYNRETGAVFQAWVDEN